MTTGGVGGDGTPPAPLPSGPPPPTVASATGTAELGMGGGQLVGGIERRGCSNFSTARPAFDGVE